MKLVSGASAIAIFVTIGVCTSMGNGFEPKTWVKPLIQSSTTSKVISKFPHVAKIPVSKPTTHVVHQPESRSQIFGGERASYGQVTEQDVKNEPIAVFMNIQVPKMFKLKDSYHDNELRKFLLSWDPRFYTAVPAIELYQLDARHGRYDEAYAAMIPFFTPEGQVRVGKPDRVAYLRMSCASAHLGKIYDGQFEYVMSTFSDLRPQPFLHYLYKRRGLVDEVMRLAPTDRSPKMIAALSHLALGYMEEHAGSGWDYQQALVLEPNEPFVRAIWGLTCQPLSNRLPFERLIAGMNIDEKRFPVLYKTLDDNFGNGNIHWEIERPWDEAVKRNPLLTDPDLAKESDQ